MSEEAHFHTSGYVNKQNCCYWAPNNLLELQHPLHSAKVTVWCAISSEGIIGPYFFENMEEHVVRDNAGLYEVMLETFCKMSYGFVNLICYGFNKWSKCSHSIDFHDSSQDNVSRQTHFSFWGHQLAHPLA
jgi:hypothetical protein